jgi:hypothetical protein
VKSHLQDLRDEGQDLLRLDPLELELRYTDWVAKVKVVLAENRLVADAGIEIIEMQTGSSLHQRAEQIVSGLETMLARTG